MYSTKKCYIEALKLRVQFEVGRRVPSRSIAYIYSQFHNISVLNVSMLTAFHCFSLIVGPLVHKLPNFGSVDTMSTVLFDFKD